MMVALCARSEAVNVDVLLNALETEDRDVDRDGCETGEWAKVAKRGGEILGRRLNMFGCIVVVVVDGWYVCVLGVVVAGCYEAKTCWLTVCMLLGLPTVESSGEELRLYTDPHSDIA